jgi:hypothetical protein
MKSRIVTVSLAVAIGLWSSVAVFAQAEGASSPATLPEQVLDESVRSELPLQGVLDDVPISGPIAGAPQPDLANVERDGEWLYAVRHQLRVTPWRRIAGAAAIVLALISLALAASFSREKKWRAYRKASGSSGGSRSRRLEEVVASVQFERSKKSDVGLATTEPGARDRDDSRIAIRESRYRNEPNWL